MLHLQNISLLHFKNYKSQQFFFNKKVVAISGLNGSGKTNLLDAIYYLCFTKSYFSNTDIANVSFGKQGLRIESSFLLNDIKTQLVCIIRENGKKEFLVDDELLKKYAEHIGKFPCVIIAPDDVAIITGSSELRRKLIDTILSQINKNYLQALINYNKILQQRNSLLKQIADQTITDNSLLSIYNLQLAETGNVIYTERKMFLQYYLPSVINYYNRISGNNDSVKINYESQLHEHSLLELLQKNYQKDIALQRTTAGVHKDDCSIWLDNNNFKNTASQGQRKSLLFALKLAEWNSLKNKKGFAPILLLDDVFEKLDEQRMFNLLQWVCKEDDGQVFITDTHKHRLQQTLTSAKIDFQLVEL